MRFSRLLRFVPAILWMAFIFYLSSQPTTGVTGSHYIGFISIYWQRFFILKFFHLVEYSVLFIFLQYALGSSPKSILVGYLYACTDEFHQSLIPGRTSRFRDTIIDLVGLAIGYFVLKTLILPILERRKK